jgi:peptide/nickel transport system permease protein
MTSPWTRFLLRRLVGLVGVLVTLVVGTFAMVQLIPGDPAVQVAGPDAGPDHIALVRHDLGLDQPVATQFQHYISGLLHGDLGTSFATSEPVSQVIATRLPFTAQIALFAIVLVLLISVPLGMAIAVACRGGRRRWLDTSFTAATGLGGAVPEYVLGTLLVVVFAIQLGWLPASGADNMDALILPVAAISLGPICALSRIVRRETATVLDQDYMRTARGRRLPALRLYRRHALPNLMTSTLTVGGLILAGLLGGAVIIEIVFRFPGMGSRVVSAILSRDYPVIQGSVLVLGLLATALNLLVDVALGLLDPRTLTAKSGGTK